jgi:hypothetical protein
MKRVQLPAIGSFVQERGSWLLDLKERSIITDPIFYEEVCYGLARARQPPSSHVCLILNFYDRISECEIQDKGIYIEQRLPPRFRQVFAELDMMAPPLACDRFLAS